MLNGEWRMLNERPGSWRVLPFNIPHSTFDIQHFRCLQSAPAIDSWRSLPSFTLHPSLFTLRYTAPMQKRLLQLSLALGLALPLIAAVPPPDDATRRLTRDIYQQLVETNTTESSGNCTTAARAMAARLEAAGFTGDDVQVLVPADAPRKGNLVARLRGSCRPEAGKTCERPLLLLAHLDVVEAKREDWSLDPFVLTEKDGYFYGRGTGDDKAMAAIWIANLIRYKQEHWTPKRDVIVALTADEETGIANGVAWLIANHRPLIDAAFALNEGGGGRLKDGRHLYHAVGASEEMHVSFALTATDNVRHS